LATDSTGTVLTFPRPPQRIVSLNPDFTSNLLALGIEERVVGGTDFCLLPGGEKVGSLSHPDLEKIVALLPDLVLATREGNRPQTVAALRRAGIKVFVAAPCSDFDGYYSLLFHLGFLLDREEAAGRVVLRIREEISEVEASVKDLSRPRVLLQLGAGPIVAVNRQTIIHRAIQAAGGINVTADWPNRYPVLSRETVLSLDPDVIVVAIMGEEGIWGARQWSDFPRLRAVREGRVFTLDPDLICRLTPRLGEGVDRLAALIHRPGEKAGEERP